MSTQYSRQQPLGMAVGNQLDVLTDVCWLIPALDILPAYGICFFIGIGLQGRLSRAEFLKLECMVGLCTRIPWFAGHTDSQGCPPGM